MAEARRSEIWLIDLGYVAEVRPCLVVSVSAEPGDRALVTMVPHATRPRGSRFETHVPLAFLREGAFDAQSLVTVPAAKLIRRLGMLSPPQMIEVERALGRWLGLPVGTP